MKFLRHSFVLGALLASACAAWCQDFPAHPVKMVIGFSAGSISDNTARVLAAKASEILGQTIIIENAPGAGATLAAARVAKAPADGYTLLFAAMGHSIAPVLYPKLPFDPVRDFSGVATVADARVMLVTQPKYPFKSLTDFIADAKAKPGKYSFGSSGSGTFLHLIGESFAKSTGIQLLHVPFKSGSEAVTSVIEGSVDLAFCTVNTCIGEVKAGKLKPLGYIARQRSPSAPEIPTFAEQGVNFDVASSNYILAPAGTPKPVLDKLHAAFNQALESPAVQEKFRRMGLDPIPSQSPAAVDAFVKSEVDHWVPVAKSLGLAQN